MRRTWWIPRGRSRADEGGSCATARVGSPASGEAAGPTSIRDGALTVAVDYESFEELWEPFAAGVGPSGAYLASLAEDTRRALLDEWRRRLGSPSGAFRLTARAWYAVGRR